MPIFGIQVNQTYESLDFLKSTDKRLQGNNVLRNPFTGGVLSAGQGPGETFTFCVVMDPLYPKFWLIGLVWIGASLLFRRSFGWYIPGLIIFSMGFFWSSLFMYIMLLKGLRKAKYGGPIRMISKHELLRRVQRLNPLENDHNFSALLTGYKEPNLEPNETVILEDG